MPWLGLFTGSQALDLESGSQTLPVDHIPTTTVWPRAAPFSVSASGTWRTPWGSHCGADRACQGSPKAAEASPEATQESGHLGTISGKCSIVRFCLERRKGKGGGREGAATLMQLSGEHLIYPPGTRGWAQQPLWGVG